MRHLEIQTNKHHSFLLKKHKCKLCTSPSTEIYMVLFKALLWLWWWKLLYGTKERKDVTDVSKYYETLQILPLLNGNWRERPYYTCVMFTMCCSTKNIWKMKQYKSKYLQKCVLCSAMWPWDMQIFTTMAVISGHYNWLNPQKRVKCVLNHVSA